MSCLDLSEQEAGHNDRAFPQVPSTTHGGRSWVGSGPDLTRWPSLFCPVNGLLALNANERLQARDTPREAGLLGGEDDRADVLVGARRFLGDAPA